MGDPKHTVTLTHTPPEPPAEWLADALRCYVTAGFTRGHIPDAELVRVREALEGGFRKGWREAMKHVRVQFGGEPREPGVYPL